MQGDKLKLQCVGSLHAEALRGVLIKWPSKHPPTGSLLNYLTGFFLSLSVLIVTVLLEDVRKGVWVSGLVSTDPMLLEDCKILGHSVLFTLLIFCDQLLLG